jgi:hypothetical protein
MLSIVLVVGLLLSSVVSARPGPPPAPQVALFNLPAAVTPPGKTTLQLVYQGYGNSTLTFFLKANDRALKITHVMPRRELTSRAAPQKPNSLTSLNSTLANHSPHHKDPSNFSLSRAHIITSLILLLRQLMSRNSKTVRGFSSVPRMRLLRIVFRLTLLRRYCCRMFSLGKRVGVWQIGL